MSIKTTAISAAKKAGKELLKFSDKKIKYKMKGKRDILAEADLKSEQIIINEIKKNYPAHNILSEETGEIINNSEYYWIIDPIDGTINFSRNLPEYCVSIAVTHKEELILGIIYNPSVNDFYIAEKGKGTFLNGKKITTSKESKTYKILSDICNKVRHIIIFGSGALHLAKIASGKIDIYYKAAKFDYWSYAAGILLIEEAGGTVTDFNGNKIKRSSKSIVASNGKIHKEILKLLN